jgi:peptidoglycan/xylan/chitin deacetylase (PgdA/CDA1 family)
VIAAYNGKAKLRLQLKWIFLYTLRFTGLLAFAKWWIRRNGAIVLTFHRILSEKAAGETCSPEGMVVTETTFESLLKHVKECYSIVDLANGTCGVKNSTIQIVITFDDGWEDNASTAFPIAVKLNVPFTIFVCPELMHKSVPFWPEQIVALMRSAQKSKDTMRRLCDGLAAAGHTDWAEIVAKQNGDGVSELIGRMKSLSRDERNRLLEVFRTSGVICGDYPSAGVDRTMSWSQLLELRRGGVTFGSHSQRHEILTDLAPAQVEQEVSESRATLEAHIPDCSLFSYPNGDASLQVRDIVAKFGFKLAFTNSPGVWLKTSDPLLVPRINLSEGTLVGRNGRFSSLAFEYRVFWNAFIHRSSLQFA